MSLINHCPDELLKTINQLRGNREYVSHYVEIPAPMPITRPQYGMKREGFQALQRSDG